VTHFSVWLSKIALGRAWRTRQICVDQCLTRAKLLVLPNAALTRLTWPFNWSLVDPTGVIERINAPPDCLLSHERSIPRDWISLPAVRVDPGYLQELANLRSDDRVMILYDEVGRPVRATRITIPLGFFAASPTHHLLFGLRSLGRTDLVVYGWRWRRTQ